MNDLSYQPWVRVWGNSDSKKKQRKLILIKKNRPVQKVSSCILDSKVNFKIHWEILTRAKNKYS